MDQLASLGSLGLGGGGVGGGGGGGRPFRRVSSPSIGSAGSPPQTTPQLVHQSDRTAIYRLYDTGYKVNLLTTPANHNNNKEQMLKLLHEQNVSTFLPLTCRKRQVTEVTTFNNMPALRYQWASGITLEEWLQNIQVGPHQVDLTVRIRAAMAIAKTLSDFHDGGVVYNSLTAKNIVLSPFDGDYAATFIDLSNSLIYRNDPTAAVDASFERQMKDMDLQSLGLVLNQLFRGEDLLDSGPHMEGGPSCRESGDSSPGNIEDQQPGRKKRGKQHGMGEGLPLYLGTLISALLESNNSDMSYVSAKDVYLDLKVLSENGPSGCLMKSEIDEFTVRSKFRVQSSEFYGRQVQLSMLMHLFQTSTALGNQPLMATISGYPGTG